MSCLANSTPSVTAPKAPTESPIAKAPPWIHTITGSFWLALAFAGRTTLRKRQSSTCWHTGPAFVASRSPVQDGAACGGRQRRSPTGGAAKGMPR